MMIIIPTSILRVITVLNKLTDDLPPDAYADPGFEAYLSLDTDPDVERLVDAPAEADGDLSTTETAPAVDGL